MHALVAYLSDDSVVYVFDAGEAGSAGDPPKGQFRPITRGARRSRFGVALSDYLAAGYAVRPLGYAVPVDGKPHALVLLERE